MYTKLWNFFLYCSFENVELPLLSRMISGNSNEFKFVNVELFGTCPVDFSLCIMNFLCVTDPKCTRTMQKEKG